MTVSVTIKSSDIMVVTLRRQCHPINCFRMTISISVRSGYIIVARHRLTFGWMGEEVRLPIMNVKDTRVGDVKNFTAQG